VAWSADEHVIVRPTGQSVVARTAVQEIATRVSAETVISVTAVETVRVPSDPERLPQVRLGHIVRSGIEPVHAVAANKEIRSWAAFDAVVARVTEKNLSRAIRSAVVRVVAPADQIVTSCASNAIGAAKCLDHIGPLGPSEVVWPLSPEDGGRGTQTGINRLSRGSAC